MPWFIQGKPLPRPLPELSPWVDRESLSAVALTELFKQRQKLSSWHSVTVVVEEETCVEGHRRWRRGRVEVEEE